MVGRDRTQAHRVVGLSVRTRITAAVSLLTMIALVGAGLVVFVLELDRVDRDVLSAAEQEVAEFQEFQRVGRDPDTGRPYSDITVLIEAYLSRNVPDDDELLVGWWDGKPQQEQGLAKNSALHA